MPFRLGSMNLSIRTWQFEYEGSSYRFGFFYY